jgi:CDGSH-type Zn-finger protein
MNQNQQESRGNGSIVLCPDGPILVRGDFDIVASSGEPVPRQRRTVALCRCGASAIKPYCDGTHKMIRFRTDYPSAPEGSDQ